MAVNQRPWLVDGRALLGHSGVRGIGTYVRELLRAWERLGVSSRVALLGAPGGDAAPPFGTRRGPALPVLKRRLQPVADPFLVSAALRRFRPALYHGVEWAQPILPFGVPVVLTIHDLIPFLYPQQFPWLRRERLLALRLARRADAVVVPSASTGRDVERLARVDPRRIHVIRHGVTDDHRPASPEAVAAVRKRLGIGSGPYLLAAGALDHHKRRDELAEVVARVRARHDVRLVISGDQGVFAPLVAAALERRGLTASTVMAGFVDRTELVALYSGAVALVFPSAHEGFGLPVLEALACGTRVVCFDNSALPEVGGDAAEVVADGDVGAMAAALDMVLSESAPRRAAGIARGRAWAAGFSWERSARRHLEVYTSVQTAARRVASPW